MMYSHGLLINVRLQGIIPDSKTPAAVASFHHVTMKSSSQKWSSPRTTVYDTCTQVPKVKTCQLTLVFFGRPSPCSLEKVNNFATALVRQRRESKGLTRSQAEQCREDRFSRHGPRWNPLAWTEMPGLKRLFLWKVIQTKIWIWEETSKSLKNLDHLDPVDFLQKNWSGFM